MSTLTNDARGIVAIREHDNDAETYAEYQRGKGKGRKVKVFTRDVRVGRHCRQVWVVVDLGGL